MSIYQELHAHASNIKTISTHSHHNYHEYFEGFNLPALMRITYPGAFGAAPDVRGFDFNTNDHESWKRYFEVNACRTDALWLHKALGDIYLDGTPMSIKNYKEVDAEIREKYTRDPYFHEKIITDICNLEILVLDEHRDPGMTHNLPFVRPAMRLDWAIGADDQAKQLLGDLPDTFTEYIDAVDAFIDKRVREQGVIAFKMACAYQRPLDFKKVSFEDAKKAYLTDKNRDLGDYMMYHTCELAKKYNLPYQFHTGLGQLYGTSAMNLLGLIRDFPDVKFVLLHCSVPWVSDSIALAYVMPNVYIDLAWLFTLSASMGKRYLREALDMVSLDKFSWGCDTWTAEEGYGALLVVRQALAEEFSSRVENGLMDTASAKRGIDMILHDNPKGLYDL